MWLLLFTAILSCATDKPGATATEVVDAVMRSLLTDHDDADIAHELGRMRLRQRLDDETVRFLLMQKPGSRTATALENLTRKSAGLPAPAEEQVMTSPVPSQPDQQRILANVTRYVARYVHGLPDFTCTKVTRRYTNLHSGKKMSFDYQMRVHYDDTVKERMGFVRGHDFGNLPDVRGGESMSRGEFGGDMEMILGNPSASVVWNRWEQFGGRRAAVFSYFLPQEKSKYLLVFCCIQTAVLKEAQQRYRTAIDGFLYADPDTGTGLRLTIHAVHLPDELLIKESRTVIDYGPVLIAESGSYILPLKATTYMETPHQKNRNDIAFKELSEI